MEVGRGQIQRDPCVFERAFSERNLEPVQDQTVVDQAEALSKREDLRQNRPQEREIVAPFREFPRPEPPRHLFGGVDVDPERDERGIDAAAAASDDQVDADAFPVEDLLESERRRALDAPRPDDERDAAAPPPSRSLRDAQAGKLATAEPTSGKT